MSFPTLTPLEMGLAACLIAVIAFLLYSKFVAKVSPKAELDILLHKVHPTQTVVTTSSPPGAQPVTITVGATTTAPVTAQTPTVPGIIAPNPYSLRGTYMPPLDATLASVAPPVVPLTPVVQATVTAASPNSQSIATPPQPMAAPMSTQERTALLFAVEGPLMAKWLNGVVDDANFGRTYLQQPAHPEVPDAWSRYWTTMTELWPLHPEWGTGVPSYEAAYEAAVKLVGTAASSPRTSLPLPVAGDGNPDVLLVSHYNLQGTIQEKARFYSDNAAILGRYQFNLDGNAQVMVLLSKGLGALDSAIYDASTNTYVMPDGRTLGQWSLAELGLDK